MLGDENHCGLRSRTCSCLKYWFPPRTTVALEHCGQFLSSSRLERNLVFSAVFFFFFFLVCADLILQVNVFSFVLLTHEGNKILAMLFLFVCD